MSTRDRRWASVIFFALLFFFTSSGRALAQDCNANDIVEGPEGDGTLCDGKMCPAAAADLESARYRNPEFPFGEGREKQRSPS